MSGLVHLAAKRNRGWPWPEDSFGLTPMFGDDGWCHACGVPQREQTGSIVLQRKGFKTTGRAWEPSWQHDVLCVERDEALSLAGRFGLGLRDVEWHPSAPCEASQILAPVVGEAWFDHDELRERTAHVHGRAGATCEECGVWRWLPLGFSPLPPLNVEVLPPLLELPEVAIAVSPEWFGDGLKAYREMLVARELAEVIAAASPRDFSIVDPAVPPIRVRRARRRKYTLEIAGERIERVSRNDAVSHLERAVGNEAERYLEAADRARGA